MLERTAYLNAGTCGPTPRSSTDAIVAELQRGIEQGRSMAYYERLGELCEAARGSWGRLLGAPSSEIALTAGATDGIARTLSLVPWREGDEVVITDEEHPGVTGPVVRCAATTASRCVWPRSTTSRRRSRRARASSSSAT